MPFSGSIWPKPCPPIGGMLIWPPPIGNPWPGIGISPGLRIHRGNVRNGNDQVGHGIGRDDQVALLVHPAGDLQHVVLNGVRQVMRFEHQVERTFDLDAIDVDRDRCA